MSELIRIGEHTACSISALVVDQGILCGGDRSIRRQRDVRPRPHRVAVRLRERCARPDRAGLARPQGAFGFSFTDDSGSPPAIADVALIGPDAVAITLSASPAGASGRLRYAFSGDIGAHGGPTTGPRGNLRDSDATPSRDGDALYNWCIHFDEPVGAL